VNGDGCITNRQLGFSREVPSLGQQTGGEDNMYKWDPQDYARHSRGQETWAKELLALVDLQADDVVLDIGCGDGRTTAAIAASVPQGRVLGVDLSADMVSHAATQHCRPPTDNLQFARADAGALAFEAEFSVVFSNATLHWVPDQRAAVHGIARALRPCGRFVAQMGGRGNCAAAIAAFEKVGATPRWRETLAPMQSPYGFNAPADYERWLREARLEILECRLIPKDMVHENHTAFIGWLRTAWHPYASRVPVELRDAFVVEAADCYVEDHPADEEGRIHVAMVRLQVRAQKAA
jgi:trans-aconitate 2-methyltransferase